MQVKRAVILWAGYGRRISNEYGGIHKAMIPLNGVMLMERELENLYQAGITDIVPVLGYRAKDMLKIITDFGKFYSVVPVFNDRFRETNNLYSLVQAKEYLMDKDFVVVNGDMVFDYRILKKICNQTGNAIATDINEYPYCIDSPRVLTNTAGYVCDIGRHMEREDANGYAIGIYKFSKEYSSKYFADGELISKDNPNAGYHEPLIKCFNDTKWEVCSTESFEWMDVDEKADVEKAEAMTLRIQDSIIRDNK